MAEKFNKTNVMRLLDQAKVQYTYYTYDHADQFADGVTVAQKLGQDVRRVYKTLVTRGASKTFFGFVIPVAQELDLKAAARAVGEKSIEMIHVDELTKVTGYIRGGCSPLGMKKAYRTTFDESCLAFDTILVSAGRRGVQIELSPHDLIRLAGAATAPIAVRQEG